MPVKLQTTPDGLRKLLRGEMIIEGQDAADLINDALYSHELADEVARLREALAFYARRDHWMALSSEADAPDTILVAMKGALPPDGWAVATAALVDPAALGAKT